MPKLQGEYTTTFAIGFDEGPQKYGFNMWSRDEVGVREHFEEKKSLPGTRVIVAIDGPRSQNKPYTKERDNIEDLVDGRVIRVIGGQSSELPRNLAAAVRSAGGRVG